MANIRYQSQTGSRAELDQGLKSYMLGVYNYMGLGIAVAAILVLAAFTIPAFGAVTKVLAFPAMLADERRPFTASVAAEFRRGLPRRQAERVGPSRQIQV